MLTVLAVLVVVAIGVGLGWLEYRSLEKRHGPNHERLAEYFGIDEGDATNPRDNG